MYDNRIVKYPVIAIKRHYESVQYTGADENSDPNDFIGIEKVTKNIEEYAFKTEDGHIWRSWDKCFGSVEEVLSDLREKWLNKHPYEKV
jgi:hypothetical protein